jgi:type I restriction enzyme M protein
VNLDLDGIGVLESAWRPVLLSRRASSLLRPYFESGPAYEHFRSVLEQCLEALGTRRLLLVIDEFDRLQEGITSGVTSDQVPENIRHLFQTYNQMAGILTGSRKIRRMREEYWNVLFGIGDPVILRGLEESAVRDLITKPVQGYLTYAPEAVDAIAHLTAGQPRIIQTLCSRLFDLCTQVDNSRLITLAMVEQVAEEKARDYEHFKVVWSAIQSPVDQFVALTINGMERAGGGRVTFSLLQDELAEQGLSISQKKLDVTLDNLRDLEVIGERITDSTKHYFIEIPLLSRWLLQNQDHDRLREDAQNELF